ncbi:MAG: hypothetical protein ACR2JF_13015 [Iamia sp.]
MAVPVLLVVVALILGDHRRWPVRADAAVANGTALRIVPAPVDADADHRAEIERIGSGGVETLSLDFARGPAQVAQVAGSPAGWIAVVTYRWADGRPDGRELWRRAPDGAAQRVAVVTPADDLIGIDDDGTIATLTAPGEGIRTWPRQGDGVEISALTLAGLDAGEEATITAAALDPDTGTVTAMVEPGPAPDDVTDEDLPLPPRQLAQISPDGQVQPGPDDAENLITSVVGGERRGGPRGVLAAREGSVTLLGSHRSRPVLPDAGEVDEGLDAPRMTEDEPPAVQVALTADGGVVSTRPAGVEDPGGPTDSDRREPPTSTYLVGPADGRGDGGARTVVGGIPLVRPTTWWPLGPVLGAASVILATAARRSQTEAGRRGAVRGCIVVGAVAIGHLVLQILWGAPGGVISLLGAGLIAAIALGAAAIPPRAPSTGDVRPDRRGEEPTGDRDGQARRRALLVTPAALLVALVVAAAAVGDQRTSLFWASEVSPTGDAHRVVDESGVIEVTSLIDGGLTQEIYPVPRDLGVVGVSDLLPVRAAPGGTVAIGLRESQSGDGSVLVVDPDGETREVPTARASFLLGVDAEGTLTMAEAGEGDDVRTAATRIVRITADGARTPVAELDIAFGRPSGLSRTDPISGDTIIVERGSRFDLSAASTDDGTFRIIVVGADGRTDLDVAIDAGQVPASPLTDAPAPAVGPDGHGLFGTTGYLPLRPEPGPVRPLELDEAVTGLLRDEDALSDRETDDPDLTGGRVQVDGTLRVPGPVATIAPDGSVEVETISSCDDNDDDDDEFALDEPCRVVMGGVTIPTPWTTRGHLLALIATLALAALVLVSARQAQPSGRAVGRSVAVAGLLTLGGVWTWALVRMHLWAGAAPPGGEGPSQPTLVLSFAFLAATTIATVALLRTDHLRARVRARRSPGRPDPSPDSEPRVRH